MIKFIKSEELNRLHDRLKSLEADKKVLKLAKETLEAENLKLHNKIVEHVRDKEEMQRKFSLENREFDALRGKYIALGSEYEELQIENDLLKQQIESLKSKKTKTKK